MKHWDSLTGNTAAELAAREQIARPGTFPAVALKWVGDGEPPDPAAIAGTVKCGYCGNVTGFLLTAMTSQVRCNGCPSSHKVAKTDKAIDGKPGVIVTAAVHSHTAGTALILPELEISDVSPLDEKTAAASRVPAVLGSRDCYDREKIKAFIEAGGDINARDESQWTALHSAATIGLPEAVRNLLDFGADPDLPVLPGGSVRTIDVVRKNRQPNATLIEDLLVQSVKAKRKASNQCVNCGKSLGLLDRLLRRMQHWTCETYRD